MEPKKELQNLDIEANDLLSEYIQIHDKILNTAGKSVTIFKKIDFRELFNDCQKLSERSDHKKEKIYSFRSNQNYVLTDTEKIYLDQLILFIVKLDIAIKILTEKQKLLFEKSGGDQAPSNGRTYSLISRLIWLPVLQAPLKIFFIRIILPSIILSVIYHFYMKDSDYLNISIICFLIFSWLFSLTYGKNRKSVTWKKYSEIEKKYQHSINDYMAAGEQLNKLNKSIFNRT